MARRAHFKVEGLRRFNGASQAKITIIESGDHALFTVRPYKRRKVYDWPLADVAALVIDRSIRRELAEKKALKKKGR